MENLGNRDSFAARFVDMNNPELAEALEGGLYWVLNCESAADFITEIENDLNFARQSLADIPFEKSMDSFPSLNFVNIVNNLELLLNNLTLEARSEMGESFLQRVGNELSQLWQKFSEVIQVEIPVVTRVEVRKTLSPEDEALMQPSSMDRVKLFGASGLAKGAAASVTAYEARRNNP